MIQCAIPAAEQVTAESSVRIPLGRACGDLFELLATVTDGRSDRGRDHPVVAVLALAAAARVAGMTGYTAIADWIADVPAQVRADLYARAGATPAPALARPPSGGSCRPPMPAPSTKRSVHGWAQPCPTAATPAVTPATTPMRR